MQSPVHRPSRKDLGFLPLPRLDSNGWQTPTGASTAASSPWDDGTHNPYAEISPVTTRPQPLRLSLLQHRMDSASSTSANAPESPRPLSPLSPRYSRPEGSALGIIVPPGTPPADALPRWLVDRQFSRPRPRLAGNRTPSKGPDTHSPFETAFSSASPAIHDWHNEFRPLVRTPEELTPFQGPSGSSHDSFPFDLGAISGERINTPVGPRVRPRPLPRCSSDDIADNRLFRVNAWGEHRSPIEASGGLFALMQGHGYGEPRARPRHLPPSRLVSTAPSPMPSPPA